MAGRRLLLVDDNDAVRLTTSVLFEDAGFEVVEARSLAEARGRLGDQTFAAAVVDQHLDDGLGSELIPELRARQPGAAVVLLTGAVGPEPMDAADAVLTKGLDPTALVQAIDRLIADRRR